MKYRLKKDLPGLKAGEIIETPSFITLDPYIHENIRNLPEWFEPIPERIELRFGQLSFDDESSGALYRKDLKPITKDQLNLMEQAINGELFTKEDMMKFGHKCRCRNCHSIEDLMKEFITKNHGTLNKP